jgi:hypothetical protein
MRPVLETRIGDYLAVIENASFWDPGNCRTGEVTGGKLVPLPIPCLTNQQLGDRERRVISQESPQRV